jgi:succinylglutamate desuccinylase
VGAAAGPTLVAVGGVHGNEPAGVRACQAVLARAADLPLAGELVALAGNLGALRLGRRYLARDLNRLWSARALNDAAAPDDAEARERAELRAQLDAAVARARGPVFFIDLHTTSAPGIPFLLGGASEQHRAFAQSFPLPGLFGFEPHLEGVLTDYLTARGCTTLACEGGQHESAEAAAHLEAFLWVALAAAGLCAPAVLPGHDAARAHLERARAGLPQTIEVIARQPATEGFVMEPGFANIAPVAAGQLLARDRRGPIHAASDGLVLMPLYQPLGSDGFFFGRAA